MLIAILAWAMMEWPWVVQVKYSLRHLDGPIGNASPYSTGPDIFMHDSYMIVPQPNPRLLYPALALAAFVGWKAAWAIARSVAAEG